MIFFHDRIALSLALFVFLNSSKTQIIKSDLLFEFKICASSYIKTRSSICERSVSFVFTIVSARNRSFNCRIVFPLMSSTTNCSLISKSLSLVPFCFFLRLLIVFARALGSSFVIVVTNLASSSITNPLVHC